MEKSLTIENFNTPIEKKLRITTFAIDSKGTQSQQRTVSGSKKYLNRCWLKLHSTHT